MRLHRAKTVLLNVLLIAGLLFCGSFAAAHYHAGNKLDGLSSNTCGAESACVICDLSHNISSSGTLASIELPTVKIDERAYSFDSIELGADPRICSLARAPPRS